MQDDPLARAASVRVFKQLFACCAFLVRPRPIPGLALNRQRGKLRLSMAKARARRPKQRTITIEQFDHDVLGALAAARKPGGVVIVDGDGNVRFRMNIPHTALPESRG